MLFLFCFKECFCSCNLKRGVLTVPLSAFLYYLSIFWFSIYYSVFSPFAYCLPNRCEKNGVKQQCTETNNTVCNADPQSTNTGKCCFFTVHVKMCSKSSSVYIQYKQWLYKVPQSLCSINTKYITDNGLIWLFILGTIVAVLMLLILLAGVVVVFYLRRKHQLCFKDEQSKYAMNREVISLILSFHRTLVVLQWNSMLTLFYYY